MDLSVRFIRIFFLLLVSERSGRRKPPAERSALYNNAIEQFRISVSSIAHVPGNQFYCSPGTRINCPYSGYHELLLPLCPGGRYRKSPFLYAFYFSATVVVTAVYYRTMDVLYFRLAYR